MGSSRTPIRTLWLATALALPGAAWADLDLAARIREQLDVETAMIHVCLRVRQVDP